MPHNAPQPASTQSSADAAQAQALQLAYALAHDLQTPLTVIAGQLSMAHRAILQGADAKPHLIKANNSVQRVASLLEDLMAYAKAGVEHHAPELIDVGDMTRQLVDELRHFADSKNVSVRQPVCDRTLTLFADRRALERSILNLLSNAIKFTAAAEGPHEVLVFVGEVNNHIRLTIADSGPGIPEPMRANLFQPFKRAHPNVPGTGLGLAMVKRCADQLGGKVWLEDNPPRGTKAILELPMPVQQRIAA
ncbi:MAG: HAMP domain-containing sensor histidine kinase [Phycisphaerales bacterium]